MPQFIEKYRDQITGELSGWDRLVLRGTLRRLNYGGWSRELGAVVARGMEEYLWQNRILFKDYAEHVKRVSQRLKEESLKPFRRQGLPVIFVRSPKVVSALSGVPRRKVFGEQRNVGVAALSIGAT